MVETYFTVEVDLPLNPHLGNILANNYNEGPSQPLYFTIPNQARHHHIKPQMESIQQNPPTDNNIIMRTQYPNDQANVTTGQDSSEVSAPQGTPKTQPLSDDTENYGI